MPLIAPILDLLIGLALRLIIWLVVATAKLVARFVWSATTNHPGLTFLGLKVAEREGWIVSPYTPFVLAGLGVLAIVRFCTAHPPAQVIGQVRQEARKAYEVGAAIHDGGSKARSWVADRVRRKDNGPSGNDEDFAGFPDPPRSAAANEPVDRDYQAEAADGTHASDAAGKTDLDDELDVRVDDIPDHLDVTEVHPEPDAGDEPLVTSSSNGEKL